MRGKFDFCQLFINLTIALPALSPLSQATARTPEQQFWYFSEMSDEKLFCSLQNLFWIFIPGELLSRVRIAIKCALIDRKGRGGVFLSLRLYLSLYFSFCLFHILPLTSLWVFLSASSYTYIGPLLSFFGNSIPFPAVAFSRPHVISCSKLNQAEQELSVGCCFF